MTEAPPAADELSTSEMRRRFLALYSASIYDVLDGRGYPNQCLTLAIAPLAPGMSVAGPAFTVTGSREPRPEQEYEPEHMKGFAMLDAIPAEHVVVIDGSPEGPVGNWGELLSTANADVEATFWPWELTLAPMPLAPLDGPRVPPRRDSGLSEVDRASLSSMRTSMPLNGSAMVPPISPLISESVPASVAMTRTSRF
jgi:hypothetical protein